MNTTIRHDIDFSRYPAVMNDPTAPRKTISSLIVSCVICMSWESAGAQDVSGRMPPIAVEGAKTRLLPVEGLKGWTVVSGEATIEYQDGILHGYGAGDRNAFLMSDRIWGDFILEGEVHIEPGGNSGWQIRSRIDDPTDPRSRLRGYQVEVETTERKWSGGIYEEGLRGWLDPLIDDEPARAAFKLGQWNRYRIEAEGIHLRTWVNGVPCGDLLDLARLEGHIAFQIHTGTCDVRWRELVITDLGRSRFTECGTWTSNSPPGDSVGGGVEKMTFIPRDGTSTVRFKYTLRGRSVLMIQDEKDRVIMELALQEDPPFRSGLGMESRFPEVVPGAGMPITEKSEGSELVIDLHQGRLTVLRDGSIVAKRYDLKCSEIGALRVVSSDEGDGFTDFEVVHCLESGTNAREIER